MAALNDFDQNAVDEMTVNVVPLAVHLKGTLPDGSYHACSLSAKKT